MNNLHVRVYRSFYLRTRNHIYDNNFFDNNTYNAPTTAGSTTQFHAQYLRHTTYTSSWVYGLPIGRSMLCCLTSYLLRDKSVLDRNSTITINKIYRTAQM